MPPLLLRGGRVIDPASSLDRTADVAVDERGRIASVAPGLSPIPGAAVIDCAGLIVCPGLIDPHVHLREPGQEHKETIATGAAAAAAGGFTTVCCMPNTSPALDSAAMIEAVRARADAALRDASEAPESPGSPYAGRLAARVFAVGAVSKGRKGEELAEIALMARAGAVGFSDDGDCVMSAGLMSRALAAVAPTGRAVMQHCQDHTMTGASAMHAGPTAVRLGLVGWPSAAEEIIIERDLRLNRAIGSRYHLQHLSAAGAVDIVRRARREGQPVTAEASPHHLLLTDEACDNYNTAAKMNPPLRTGEDVAALIEGVRDGTVTILASDHAPHTPDEKALPFEAAPFGIVGLETALALYIEALITPGVIGWPRLLEMLTINPARLCGLDRCGIGSLAPGNPADITVIDPEVRWTIGEADLAGKCRNSPFLGRAARGRAVMTFIGGEPLLRAPGLDRRR